MKRLANGVFIVRLAVGAVLCIAGILKVSHITALAASITGFALLPRPLIAPLALFLPYFEIALGAYFIIGLFTRAVAGVAGLQFLIFAGAITSVIMRGLSVSCGCFGPGDDAPASWWDVARDLMFMGLSLGVMVYGPGRWALDLRFQHQARTLKERSL